MKVGKLDWNDLKDIINKNKSIKRKDVRVRSGIGEDCSVINYGDYECVVSTDPITAAEKNIGKLAVHINCNDIASSGVETVGILVTILAPPKTELEDIKEIMHEIDEETKKLNVEILGGHTEITTAVNRIIVSCTAIGKGKSKSAVATGEASVGDDIIVTKGLCLEGTNIVINDYIDKVKDVLSEEEISEAKKYFDEISVVKEGKIAGDFGVNSMHDITEGGILGAVFEVAKASNVGFKIEKSKLPISDVTKKICDKLNIDPLRFISSGSMLITTPKGMELINKLDEEGIKAFKVGKITNDRGILISEGTEKEVLPPKADELYKI